MWNLWPISQFISRMVVKTWNEFYPWIFLHNLTSQSQSKLLILRPFHFPYIIFQILNMCQFKSWKRCYFQEFNIYEVVRISIIFKIPFSFDILPEVFTHFNASNICIIIALRWSTCKDTSWQTNHMPNSTFLFLNRIFHDASLYTDISVSLWLFTLTYKRYNFYQ